MADEIPRHPTRRDSGAGPGDGGLDNETTPAEPAPTRTQTEPSASAASAHAADKPAPTRTRRGIRSAVEWVAVIGGALVIALLVRAFLVQAFSIPSESMEPTLTRGDRLLVDKVSYRFGDVRRGDIVVFDSPHGPLADTNEPLIKRVVGMEGEAVEILDGYVTIDGYPLQEPYLGPNTLTFSFGPVPGCAGGSSPDMCIVAEGHIFVLGDNRSSSRDSRFFGPVEIETIVGRAWLKYWPPGDFGTL